MTAANREGLHSPGQSAAAPADHANPVPGTIGVLAGVAASLPSVAESLTATDLAWRAIPDTGHVVEHEITTLVIGGGSFDAAAIARFPRLRLLVRAGIGIDLIDITEASRRDIVVVNTPGYGTQEVADQALLLMLSTVRRLHHFERQARDSWLDVSYSGVRRLAGSTLGVVGFGAIGQAMSARAQTLGMRVVAYDPVVSQDVLDGAEVAACSLETLLATSDVISLHAPLTDDTRHILDDRAFARMKRRPVIINTSRGGLINGVHLTDALDAGLVVAAGLDVVDGEPAPPAPLLRRDDVIVTPHVGWYSEGARDEMGRLAAAAAIDFIQSGATPAGLNSRI